MALSLDEMRLFCVHQGTKLANETIDREAVIDAATVVFGVLYLVRRRLSTHSSVGDADRDLLASLAPASARFQWVRDNGQDAPLGAVVREVREANRYVLQALALAHSTDRMPAAVGC